ncbi:MAG: phosphopyruvate hydratase [Hydrotalea sp.]|nr:phosphopyruvate hydratase [Hydrotalea sp.]
MRADGASITAIAPLEILDSRGNPTLQVTVRLLSGAVGVAAVPSGASTGKHEAVEWRDGDKKRYGGKGVQESCEKIKGEVSDLLLGQHAGDQLRIDKLLCDLDGSDNKQTLGANTILAVSLAVAHAAANHYAMPLYRYLGGVAANILPVPMMNIINGGMHADNALDIQEFMVMPVGFNKFSEALRAGTEIFHSLKSILKKKSLSTNVGDEGGFAPNLSSAEEALSLMNDAVTAAGYKPGGDIFYALDCASTEFFKDGIYDLVGMKKKMTASQLTDYLAKLCDDFPIISIEDAMAEDDIAGWEILTKKLGNKIQLVGDDLFVTNPKRLQMGIDKNLANALLVKVNQIGSLSETLTAVGLAHRHNYRAVMSHRSGETEDTTIADLAVATNCGQIKTGAPSRGERTAKYNRLLAIENQLGNDAIYAGRTILKK